NLDPKLTATVFYGALEETLTGWVMGQLPETDEDIERAEHNVAELLCDGLTAR
ncbi:MAG: TetR/AcrR family transcriptional regulator, partial [Actinobacteria bacterium]|nr:TetR/AcrR family transcriptional regulator [Actinomycetota bacterium]